MEKYYKGFTIIEVLVVVTIISVLTSIVLASASLYAEKGRITAATAEVKELEKAALLYYADTGQYPAPCNVNVGGCTSATDPFSNALGIPGWKGPYFSVYNLAHAWGGQVGWGGVANDIDGDGKKDFLMWLDDDRPQTGSGDNLGKIPVAVLQKIDVIIDDGNLTTGNARGDGAGWPGYLSAAGELEIIYHP